MADTVVQRPGMASSFLPSGRALDYLFLILAALASRAVFVIVGSLAIAMADAPVLGMGLHPWFELAHRFDSGWYINLIGNGYSAVESPVQPGATNFSFFPFYPLVVRAVMTLLDLHPLVAAVLVSNVAFLAALILVYEYARSAGLERGTALVAAGLLCVTPQNFVFSVAYTEALFLALLALAMLSIRREWWLVGGIAAAALSATRSNGLFVALFAAVHLWRTHGPDVFLRPWRRPELLVIPALAPLGLVLYWWFCFTATGDAFAQATTAGHGWGWVPRGIADNLSAFIGSPEAHIRFWALSSLSFFAASLLLLRYRLYAEFAFCLACFLLYWTGNIPNSLTRYAMVLFPIYLGLALATRRHPAVLAGLAAVMAMVNGFLIVAWALQWPIAI